MGSSTFLSSTISRSTNSEPQNAVSRGVGREAKIIDADLLKAYSHFSEPISRMDKIKKFDQLAATWEYDNNAVSSIQNMVLAPAYQEIIGMGKEALPLILKELKNNPNYWFWALKSITGENPIKTEDRGNIKKMTEAWLSWGQQNGYVI